MIGTYLGVLGSLVTIFAFLALFFMNKLTLRKALVVLGIAAVIAVMINTLDSWSDISASVGTHGTVNDNSTVVVEPINIKVSDYGMEPKEGQAGTRFLFYVNSNFTMDQYETIIQFADENGTYKKEYDPDYYQTVDKLDFIQNKWSISKNFKQTGIFTFRFLIKNIYSKVIWTSEERQITVTKDNTKQPYVNITDNIKVGSLFQDKASGITLSVANINSSFTKIYLTFSDGTKDSGYYETGKTWDYKYDNKKFRIIFYNPDDKSQTFSLKVEELPD